MILKEIKKDRWQLLWQEWPQARSAFGQSLSLHVTEDVTGDGAEDLILKSSSGDDLIVSRVRDKLALYPLPIRCTGSLILEDTNANGLIEIVRDGCYSVGRLILEWTGDGFDAR